MTLGKCPTGQGTGQRVLVVDDEPLLGEAIGRLLVLTGYTADVALTAHHAEFLASTRIFDCAIIDVSLGNEDGITLACRLLATRRVKRVVFYTGAMEEDTMRRALSVGIHVDKGGRFEELALAVEAAMAGGAPA